MQKAKTCMRLEEAGVFAIVRTPDKEEAARICEALLAGGVDTMEVSYTFFNAGETIRYLKERFGDRMLIGAGTVLDGETCRDAINHGAEFVIAPNFSEAACKCCNRYQIPYAPGCTSITEAVNALEAGASFIKCFPICDFYGPDLVRAFRTPIPWMPLMGSGGVTLENLHIYLENGMSCCGISRLLTKGSSEQITENARAVKEIVKNVRNCK